MVLLRLTNIFRSIWHFIRSKPHSCQTMQLNRLLKIGPWQPVCFWTRIRTRSMLNGSRSLMWKFTRVALIQFTKSFIGYLLFIKYVQFFLFVSIIFLLALLYLLKFVPNDLNEKVKELSVWKRFKDFKELHRLLSKYHQSLHRRQVFPDFVKPNYFGRFDQTTIDERKDCILKLLQFCATQPHIYSHEKFIDFFSVWIFIHSLLCLLWALFKWYKYCKWSFLAIRDHHYKFQTRHGSFGSILNYLFLFTLKI